MAESSFPQTLFAQMTGILPTGQAVPVQLVQQQMELQSRKRAREEQELAHRQERNRIHARKSRLKKKMAMSRLEQEEENLKKENARLKQLIKDHIPDYQTKNIFGNSLDQNCFQLLQSLAATHQCYVITDPRLPDHPVVYASDSFCKLTEFRREHIVGRNCRILQGPDTDGKAVDVIRNAISKGTDCTTVLLNYKANGSPFWNRLFIAGLRDRSHQIVNYVGVLCEQNGPQANEADAATAPIDPTTKLENIPPKPVISMEPAPLAQQAMEAVKKRRLQMMEEESQVVPTELDWSILAETLEADANDDVSVDSHFDDGLMTFEMSQTASMNQANDFDMSQVASLNQANDFGSEDDMEYIEPHLETHVATPLDFLTKTVRSEVIDSLLNSQGDVSDHRFVSALSVLSSIYSSSGKNASQSFQQNGTWRSIQRPHYSGCLGRNNEGDFMYTLGKMSFDMFKPGNLICSVQRTLNRIETVCEMDGAPSAAPWSLRRELAAWDQTTTDNFIHQVGSSATDSMLKSYNIAVALTIEPDQDAQSSRTEQSRGRLLALNETQGYMLPDPNTPNRLTVWFTGGTLSPAPPASDQQLEKWKQVFGAEHKRTWGESLRVMGAKLFMGAEVPDGMSKDGTMKYMLHRPVGGHGRSYVDVLYQDDILLVLKSSYGIIHVMVRSSVMDTKPTSTGANPVDTYSNANIAPASASLVQY